MAITVQQVTKRFGSFVALDNVSVAIPSGSLTALLGPSGERQVDAPPGDRRPRAARRGPCRDPRRGRHEHGAAEARRRHGVPALRGVQAHDRLRERRVRAHDPQASEGRGARAACRSCSRSCSWTASPSATRLSSPAASGSGWRSRARWPSSRRSSCSTSPSARSTPASARSCATWLRRLHDDVHVTTVLVTHDQEEAMEVADRVVLMNDGPDRADRQAARPLRASRQRVRHELRRAGEPARRRVRPPARHRGPARAQRLHHTRSGRARRPPRLRGRIELALAGGERLWAQVTRDQADDLALASGSVVFVRPSHTRVFDGAPASAQGALAQV